MWDWVGGRFSVWSAVGFAAACAMGFDALRGVPARRQRQSTEHFAQAPLEKNVPALMALIGVWNTNFLGAPTHAVLPYSNALRLLPAYLQQLEMESNGKRVDREGRVVDYATAPVLWGGEGTVSQHSFHQLLHQGTQVVPVRLHRRRRSNRTLSANLPRARPTRSRSAPTTRSCRRTGSIPATGPRACCPSRSWTRETSGG